MTHDPIFRHAVEYREGVAYSMATGPLALPRKTGIRAHHARGRVFDLLLQGKLDAVDLRIIAALDCSPMPSEREIAHDLGIPKTTIHRKRTRFKALFKGI